MDMFFIPAVFLYAVAPLVFLVAVGLQMWVFGRSRACWIWLSVGLLWGTFILINPYHTIWLPAVFAANWQKAYMVFRAGLVLAYSVIALASIIRKSYRLRQVSVGMIVVILADLLWSFLAGRYVGP